MKLKLDTIFCLETDIFGEKIIVGVVKIAKRDRFPNPATGRIKCYKDV